MEGILGCSSHSGEHHNGRRRSNTNGGTSEWQKTAIRVCGDWSEQLSSKGKIYFYNCITEVSQWHKPPEWNLPNMDEKELYERISGRGDVNAKNLKRSRPSSNNPSCKTTSVHYQESAKKPKYSNDFSNSKLERQRPDIHQNPMKNHVSYPTESGGKYRDGESRKLEDFECPEYSSRYQSGHFGPRSVSKVDDMEISPNSSPMSFGSSSENTFSPQKAAYQTASDKRDATQRKLNATSRDEATRTNTKLKQLMETIQDLLGHTSGHSSRITTESPPTMNGVSKNHRARNNTQKLLKVSSYKHSPLSQDVFASPTTHQISPANSRSKPFTNLSDKQNNAVQRSNDKTPQDKNASSLASTLSTLANLIDTSQLQASASRVKSNASVHPAGSHTSGQSCISHLSSDSPVIPSPRTSVVAAANNRPITKFDPAQSYSLSTHQVDALLSNLQSLSHQNTPLSHSVDRSIPCGSFRHLNGSLSSANDGAASVFEQRDGQEQSSQLNALVKVIQSALNKPNRINESGSAPGCSPKSPVVLQAAQSKANCSPGHPSNWRSPSGNALQRQTSANGVPMSPMKPHSNPDQDSIVHKRPSPVEDSIIAAQSACDLILRETKCKLESPDLLCFLDSKLISDYHDDFIERLENEANVESRKFDRLQSVLFGELSVESKKLKALVRISEAKLAIHKEKLTSSKEIMKAIEDKRQPMPVPNCGDL